MLTAVRKKSRLLRWIVRAYVLLVVLVALFPVVCYALARSAATRWEQLVTDVRDSGEPLTHDEIMASRSCDPESVHGAVVIHSALTLLQDTELPEDTGVFVLDRDCSTEFFTGISASCLDTTRTYVGAVRESLDALGRLRDYTNICLDISYAEPWHEDSSEVLEFAKSYRALGKIAHADALLKIIDGDVEGAVDANLRQLQLVEPLYHEPMLLLNVVALATDRLTVQSAEGLLQSHELSVDDLTRMQREWERQMRQRTMRFALLGERAWFIRLTDPKRLMANAVAAEQPAGSGELDQEMSNGLSLFAVEWWLDENRVQGVGALTDLLAHAGQLTDLLAAARQMASHDYPMGCFASGARTMMPSITRAVELNSRGVAHFRCVPVALAAERFRVANGRFPEKPDELVPEFIEALPADPFDGKPLRLTATADGIVIYSVGSNMTDEGGAVVPKPGEQLGPDYGFRLLHPSSRGVKFIPSDE